MICMAQGKEVVYNLDSLLLVSTPVWDFMYKHNNMFLKAFFKQQRVETHIILNNISNYLETMPKISNSNCYFNELKRFFFKELRSTWKISL